MENLVLTDIYLRAEPVCPQWGELALAISLAVMDGFWFAEYCNCFVWNLQ